MKRPTSPDIDDVARLVRGRPSRNRVGSRAVAHRLRKHELEKLELAKKRGYLVVTESTRDALKNAWFLWCQAVGTECLFRARESKTFNPDTTTGT